jgi:DNA polymerase I-like protein with 3'-5' exonuclease and polymerase domains
MGSKRRSFWEVVGDDHRVRPYFGIYGAQSARSQPAATGFLPLKANWMRAFIQPPKGRAIVGIDYGSQEFLISALLSEDEEMIKAYESGDPYMYFAKLDGAIPWDGTKEEYSNERSIYKTVTLGISYLMGARSLAFKLTQELGKEYTEDDAQDLINRFYDAFPDFAEWQRDHIESYYDAGVFAKVKLPCGWYMWADNPNRKSVGNVPIQGFGSSIMRKSVALAQDRGLDVIYTLHDAIYVEYDSDDKEAVEKLRISMDEGFRHYFPDHLKSRATCRLDVFTWSKDFEEPNNIYIDKKGENDYLKYVEYFE